MTIVEVVVALFILALVLTAFAGAATVFGAKTVENHIRANATAIASDQIEQARALAFDSLKTMPGAGVPGPNFVDNGPGGDGSTLPVVTGASGCTACLPYTQTIPRGGVNYTVKQLVLQKDTFTQSGQITQSLKKLIVWVSWSSPQAGQTRIDTLINNQDDTPISPNQGVHVEAHDNTDTLIIDPNTTFGVTLVGPTGPSSATINGTTSDGIYENLNLAPGIYTCNITNNNTSLQWNPTGHPDQTSQLCDGTNPTFTVAAGSTVPQTSSWTQDLNCATGATSSTGNLTITVTNASDQPVNGALIHLDPPSDAAASGTTSPPNQTTNAQGQATFNGLRKALWTVTASSGLVSGTGTACVRIGGTSSTTVKLFPCTSSAGPPAVACINIQVVINRATGGAKNYYMLATKSTGGSASAVASSVSSSNTPGKASVNSIPAGDYAIAVCKANAGLNGCMGAPFPAGTWSNATAYPAGGKGLTTDGTTYTFTFSETSP